MTTARATPGCRPRPPPSVQPGRGPAPAWCRSPTHICNAHGVGGVRFGCKLLAVTLLHIAASMHGTSCQQHGQIVIQEDIATISAHCVPLIAQQCGGQGRHRVWRVLFARIACATATLSLVLRVSADSWLFMQRMHRAATPRVRSQLETSIDPPDGRRQSSPDMALA